MKKKQDILFIGGYGISKLTHREFIKALEDDGFNVANITMGEAGTKRDITDLVKSKIVITHSFAISQIKPEFKPAAIIAVNPPEPQPAYTTVLRILKKSFRHSLGGKHFHVLASTLELIVHVATYVKLLGKVSRFSATSYMIELRKANPDIDITVILANDDEVFDISKHDQKLLQQHEIIIRSHDLQHDAIYTHPKEVIETMFSD